MDKKPLNLPLTEIRLIIGLFDKGLTYNSIKKVVDKKRKKEGVYKGKGISTNTISKLSSGSKYRKEYEKMTREVWGEYGVIPHIAGCLNISEEKAEKIYQIRILNSGIAPFGTQHDAFSKTRETGLVSIRFEFDKCDSQIYINFTDEEYVNDYELNEDYNPVWTVGTPFTYKQVISGEVGMDEFQQFLVEKGKEYDRETGIFLNTLIKKT